MPSVKLTDLTYISAGPCPNGSPFTMMGWMRTSVQRTYWGSPISLGTDPDPSTIPIYWVGAYLDASVWSVWQYGWDGATGSAGSVDTWYFVVLTFAEAGSIRLRVFEDDLAMTKSTNITINQHSNTPAYFALQSETSTSRQFTNFKALYGRLISDDDCRRLARTRRPVSVSGCFYFGAWPLTSASSLASVGTNHHLVSGGTSHLLSTAKDEPRALRYTRRISAALALSGSASLYSAGTLSVTARLYSTAGSPAFRINPRIPLSR